MADSLIDFGKIAQLSQNNIQNAISLGWLQQRNEQNDIRQQRADMADVQAKQTAMMNLHKLGQDPVILSTPGAKAQIYDQIGKIAGAPALNLANIQLGDQAKEQYIAGLVSGDQERVRSGLHGLLMAAPSEDVDRTVKALAGMGKAHEDALKLQAWREENAAKVQELQEKNARVNIAKPLYASTSAEFRDALRGTDSPQFKTWQSLQSKDPSKDLAGKLGVLGGKAGNKALQASAEADRYLNQAQQAQKLLTDADHGIDLPEGVTKANLHAVIETSGALGGAYRSMQEWYEKPLDKDKLAGAKAAYRTIEARRIDTEALDKNAQAETLKHQQEALAFKQSEADSQHADDQRKQAYDANLAKAQAESLKKYGYSPAPADLSKVATKYGVKPSDLMHGLSDPEKKGKLEVGIVKMGQEDMSRQFKTIESAQHALDYISDFRDVIKENPSIVGRPAQLGAAMAGAGQQLRALVSKDPAAAKFLNTKPRDNAEALYEMLVYAQARTMDSSGPLDLKVVENARKVIGDLNSFTTGPQQMLNKLDTIERQASKSMRSARQRLSGGVESYQKDGAASEKPFNQMTDDELMKEILGGGMP